MRIDEKMIYLTDNGRAVCGAHLGASARLTGRDISGQEIMPVTLAVAQQAASMGWSTIACEECGQRSTFGVLLAASESWED